jgi:hypothetical protein
MSISDMSERAMPAAHAVLSNHTINQQAEVSGTKKEQGALTFHQLLSLLRQRHKHISSARQSHQQQKQKIKTQTQNQPHHPTGSSVFSDSASTPDIHQPHSQ